MYMVWEINFILDLLVNLEIVIKIIIFYVLCFREYNE